jgi:hypothetical protein
VPVSPRWSRKASSKVTRGSSFKTRFLPLTSSITSTGPGPSGSATGRGAALTLPEGLISRPAVTAPPATPAAFRKLRRDMPGFPLAFLCLDMTFSEAQLLSFSKPRVAHAGVEV